MGAPLEPDYPESVSIISMKRNGEHISDDLFNDNLEEVEEEALKFISNERESAEQAKADLAYDEWRDRKLGL